MAECEGWKHGTCRCREEEPVGFMMSKCRHGFSCQAGLHLEPVPGPGHSRHEWRPCEPVKIPDCSWTKNGVHLIVSTLTRPWCKMCGLELEEIRIAENQELCDGSGVIITKRWTDNWRIDWEVCPGCPACEPRKIDFHCICGKNVAHCVCPTARRA